MSTTRRPDDAPRTGLDRRELLKAAAAASAAGLLPGLRLPSRPGAGAHASLAPEITEVRIGYVAVQSCAAIIIGHEKGFFRKHGLTVTLAKENGWAAVRDKVVSGENHASHFKQAQPIAGSIGLLGAPKTPIVAPFTLARQGSVFMAAAAFKGALTMDPKTWKAAIEAQRAKGGDSFTIALPLPFGWHGMMYRYFLANAGLHCDRDLKLITLPPAQMVQNIRVGTMQACAMVEPWGARGVADRITTIVMYGHELWPNHPTKSFGMLESFAEQNPRTTRALLRGLHEAAAWCDNPANYEEMARILSAPTYMNSPVPTILNPLRGQFDWGDGRKATLPDAAIKYSRDNYPQAREAKWLLTQWRRWGWIEGAPDYDTIARKVTRPEIYEEAMKELGFAGFKANTTPIKFWDGTVFDPAKPEPYAKSFAVNSLKG